MKYLVYIVVTLLLAGFVSAECITPVDDLEITESVTFCGGTHKVEDLRIMKDNLVLDCGGAKLEGNLRNTGLVMNRLKNVVVKNCQFVTYKKAVSVSGGERIKILDSTLARNVIGVYKTGNADLDTSTVLFQGNENNGIDQPIDPGPKEKPREKVVMPFDNVVPEDVFGLLGITEDQHVPDKVRVEKEVAISGEESEFTVTLTPLLDIENLVVYEHFPKHVAQHASEIEFNKDVVVVNEDPDFMIPIGRVKAKVKIEVKYKIGKKVNLLRDLPSTIVSDGEPVEEEVPLVEEDVLPAEPGKPFLETVLFKIMMMVLIVIVSFVTYRLEKKIK